MRLPFVTRRRHDALRTEKERLRAERDRALKSANTWHGTASRASELFTDTSIVNECLTRDLSNLRRRHERAVHAASRYLAALWQERARLAEPSGPEAAGEWMALYRAEKRRADGLQRRLDDAVGLNTSKVDSGRNWQSTREDRRTFGPKGGVS